MVKYLVINKIYCGYQIKDSINNKAVKYYCSTLKKAIATHRYIFKLKYIHFEKIFI